MEVKIKKLSPKASIPHYSKSGDAGMDLVAISMDIKENYVEYRYGLAIEIPEGYVGLIFPRSSISKTNLMLSNGVGVIDSGYRGELLSRFNFVGSINEESYNVGDKVAQIIIIPYPKIELKVVNELSETERGEGGFGSTGK